MACGINEHKEGCRKQRVLDRAANARSMLSGYVQKDSFSPQRVDMEDPEAPGYMRKMGSPPGIHGQALNSYDRELQDNYMVDLDGNHSPTAIDRLRREGVRAQQLVAYSAKIPHRLSSVNYTQQW